MKKISIICRCIFIQYRWICTTRLYGGGDDVYSPIPNEQVTKLS